jgi:hypothetical protein
MVSIALYRSCTATDGSTHSYCVFVYGCVCARDFFFFFLVASKHKSGLAHTAPLTRSRFIRTCSCWFLTPPKKCPNITHQLHTHWSNKEREAKVKKFLQDERVWATYIIYTCDSVVFGPPASKNIDRLCSVSFY